MRDREFDAVQFMRQARDKMNAALQEMGFEEQKAYIEQRASKIRQELELRPESTAAVTQRGSRA